MRVINADDLKEYAQKLLVGESINTYFGVNLYKMFEEIIDNAPTVPQVTVFAETASKEEIADFKQELEKVMKRPQGEWVTKEHSVEYYCSNCGERLDQYCENFCCHCGAEMGGST